MITLSTILAQSSYYYSNDFYNTSSAGMYSGATMIGLVILLLCMLLLPALAFLGCGIFLGAVWANVSWGSYWSWDAKEVWALITMMVYAIPVHSKALKILSNPIAYHIFVIFAFLVLLMTYFGVNVLFSGMHSYQ